MSDSGSRKEIEEIIAKYELEPSLEKEIYVEGSIDKAFIEWFLKKSNVKDISVLEIDTVNVEKEKVLALGLDDNMRNRIVCLISLVDNGILGIIDSDFDFIETPTYEKKDHLILTDYSSIELYGFNEETLEKIFLAYPSKVPENYQDFINMLGSVLTEIFLIRFAKFKIKKELSHIDNLKNDLTLILNNIQLNKDSYLNKYVSNNKELKKEFNDFIASHEACLPADIRKKIHGHDFIYLLEYYLDIKQRDAKEIFEKSFYYSLEYNMLKEENMFKTLISSL